MNRKASGLITQTKSFLINDLWRLEPSSLSKARRRGLKFLRVCALVIKGFREDNCPTHASALTFISVMALVPFLVILFAIAKGLGFEQASQMLLENTATMPVAFQEAVTNILTTVESASAGTLGSVSTVLFLWVAIKMLSNIEETFNLVWGVKTSRSLIDKIRNYVVIIVATPILLIISNAGQPVLLGFASRLEWMGPFLTLSLQLIPVFTMAIAFAIVYLFLPNTKVKPTAALTGAFVAALLAVLFQFIILKLGFIVGKYNRIYGTLAAIPLFLFWVQTSWMILLMGAEVAFSVQNANTYAQERFAATPSARARLCLAFALMKQIRIAFESNNSPFDAIAYGAEQRIPVRLVRDVVSILVKNDLIAEDADRPGCYTLLRAPENITAKGIALSMLNEGTDPEDLGIHFPEFAQITGNGFQALESQLLKNI